MDIDRETKHELMDGFADLHGEIEQLLMCSATLECSDDKLNQLFRAIHSIKGNAAMMQLDCLVEFTHAIEDVAESLRSDRYPLTEAISEAILLGLDRLRDLHNRELWGHEFKGLHEQQLMKMYADLANAGEAIADEYALTILDFMGAGVISAKKVSSQTEPSTAVLAKRSRLLEIPDQGTPERSQADLFYFQELSCSIDQQNPYWIDRSTQLFSWAHKMNEIAGGIINHDQLTAAVYLHDLGMMFIAHSILAKGKKLDESERSMLKEHPALGCNYLVRVPGWEEAAIMILEHHEWVNGEGYPNGIKGEAIHPGARVLAILDAFFSIVSGRADRTSRKSIVRAISEINAKVGTQFDEFWVQCFNEMVKIECKKGVF